MPKIEESLFKSIDALKEKIRGLYIDVELTKSLLKESGLWEDNLVFIDNIHNVVNLALKWIEHESNQEKES